MVMIDSSTMGRRGRADRGSDLGSPLKVPAKGQSSKTFSTSLALAWSQTQSLDFP